MSRFSESQLQDLRDLQRAISSLGAEAVIIGAMAYRVFIEDSRRETFDIDLAIALDLDEFQRLEDALVALGWSQLTTQEQRWVTPRGNRLDLVPAGQSLRKQGKLVWPRSGFVMSLAGFEHVFRDAAPHDIGDGLMYKVVPPSVLALLKIAAYLDGPQRREKDLIDLRNLMRLYQRDTDRIFSDEVFQADLSDIEFAGAFLLGLDLRAIATPAEASLIESFIIKMRTAAEPLDKTLVDDDWATREVHYFQEQISTFWRGFTKR